MPSREELPGDLRNLRPDQLRRKLRRLKTTEKLDRVLDAYIKHFGTSGFFTSRNPFHEVIMDEYHRRKIPLPA